MENDNTQPTSEKLLATVKQKISTSTSQQPPDQATLLSIIKQKMRGTYKPDMVSGQPTGILEAVRQKMGLAPNKIIDTPEYTQTETQGIFNNSVTYNKKEEMPTFKPTYDSNNPAEKTAYAIMLTETGGRQVTGASGETGAFQFMPQTWQGLSKKMYGEVLPQTMENEWRLAVDKITELLKKYSPREAALVWNTSLGGSEKPMVKKGVNSKGVKYDSGAYADKFDKYLASLK